MLTIYIKHPDQLAATVQKETELALIKAAWPTQKHFKTFLLIPRLRSYLLSCFDTTQAEHKLITYTLLSTDTFYLILLNAILRLEKMRIGSDVPSFFLKKLLPHGHALTQVSIADCLNFLASKPVTLKHGPTLQLLKRSQAHTLLSAYPKTK